ncbi:hypothetical protein PFISCL1PPCAC_12634, partial [Pristionchus fissidentatus]
FYTVICAGPKWVVDIILMVGLLLNTGWWQLTPAPCILQYLHLSNGMQKRGRKPMRTAQLLMASYAFSITMMALTAFWVSDLVPTPAFEEKLSAAVRTAYNLTDADRFLVYGISLDRDPDNNYRSIKSLAFIAFLPTYGAAYSAFFIVIHRS